MDYLLLSHYRPNKVAKMLKLKKERVAIETLRFARLTI